MTNDSLDAKKQLRIDKLAFLLLIFFSCLHVEFVNGHVTTRGKYPLARSDKYPLEVLESAPDSVVPRASVMSIGTKRLPGKETYITDH